MSSIRYRFTVPPTAEQGSHAGTCSSSSRETYRANALWDYNSARAHDGLPPVKRMPKGTKYTRIKARTRGPLVTIHDPRFPRFAHFANLP
jgi:hypothetical protein